MQKIFSKYLANKKPIIINHPYNNIILSDYENDDGDDFGNDFKFEMSKLKIGKSVDNIGNHFYFLGICIK